MKSLSTQMNVKKLQQMKRTKKKKKKKKQIEKK